MSRRRGVRRASYLVAAAVAFLLAGCSGVARRRADLAPLIGQSEADLVRTLGVPSQTFEAGGHRFLAYVDTQTATIPGSYGESPWAPWGPGAWAYGNWPPQVVQSVCQTVFELAGSKVVAVSLHGAGC